MGRGPAIIVRAVKGQGRPVGDGQRTARADGTRGAAVADLQRASRHRRGPGVAIGGRKNHLPAAGLGQAGDRAEVVPQFGPHRQLPVGMADVERGGFAGALPSQADGIVAARGHGNRAGNRTPGRHRATQYEGRCVAI